MISHAKKKKSKKSASSPSLTAEKADSFSMFLNYTQVHQMAEAC